VADKDDSGSPSDDSEEEGSDASLSGGEKEVTEFTLSASLRELFLSQKICSKALF
jgi:structure-specific recognition protein 1